MALPNSVEALVNERTGKHFIVLDWDGGDEGKVKVINPPGEVLDVPTVIFKIDEPKTITQSDYPTYFSPEQIAKLDAWERERFAFEEKKRLERAARSSQAVFAPKAAAPKPRSGSSRKEGLIDQSTSSSGRRPKVQWSSDTLVFYRHKIESLSANDVFAVVIEGRGTFQISKAEFQRKFNNIIMSPEYRNQGIFRYNEFPDDALAFMRP